ncbi:MAG: DUF1572 family protein [Chlorobi bacterium]|nr:MAG: DinB superfamily protein [Chlorobi bacterium OLB7]MBK8909966.1 DUF1572 family protein [Chlorobiota bacterium]MCE7933995.1 DUF1572 domain-containing protein [Chlorobi bacterium CHB2]
MANAQHFLDVIIADFRATKRLGERAMAQLRDDEMDWSPDGESNSIAIIVKHLSGNMISRWTDIFTTDGEKPDRNRDTEFEGAASSRAEVMEQWERGWGKLMETLESLRPEDLERTILIRGEGHTVVQAIIRQTSHYAYHVGQMVFLAKHLRSEGWQTLSVPKGKSEEFNRQMLASKKP